MLRRVLGRGKGMSLIYAGDRMWPTVRDGDRVRVEPPGTQTPLVGELVVAAPGGIPDLLRVDTVEGTRFVLRGDGDPEWRFEVGSEEILGGIAAASRRVRSVARVTHRAWLDVREALGRGLDTLDDTGHTVLHKYESQAEYYAHGLRDEITGHLMRRILDAVPAGGRILVAGSGVGTEALVLAQAGFHIIAVDFAPAMVAISRQKAAQAGVTIDCVQADLRSHQQPEGTLDAVLFTNSVYSFLPKAATRIAMLSRMRRWLKPHGVIILSARATSGWWERCILTLQWARTRGGEDGAWGAAHTRWIARDGSMSRSFVRIFEVRTLRRETAKAGFRMGPYEAGRALLHAASDPPL